MIIQQKSLIPLFLPPFNEDPKSIQNVKITKAKITFPKNFAEKYEKNYSTSKSIIETSNNLLPNITQNYASKLSYFSKGGSETNRGNLTDGYKEKILAFDEIIPEKTVYKMKKKLMKDRLDRDKLRKINENEFRTQYEDLSEIQRFNVILRT